MGTIYWVGCRTCGVVRDLDKFYESVHEVTDRKSALAMAEILKTKSFRAGLLVDFMRRHAGHNCTMFTEHDDTVYNEFTGGNWEFKNEESEIFWKPDKSEM